MDSYIGGGYSFIQGKIRGKFDEIIERSVYEYVEYRFLLLLVVPFDRSNFAFVNEYAKCSFKAIVTFANRASISIYEVK